MTILAFVAACSAPEETESPAVLRAPELSHEAPAGRWVEGDEIPLAVHAADDDGVAEVRMRFRAEGATLWDAVALVVDETGLWSGTLRANYPGVEYYFEALDAAVMPLSARLPEDAERSPFLIDVGETGLSLPWREDFEEAEGSAALYALGWDQLSLGFEGSPWEVREDRAYDGLRGVAHRRGAEGTAALEDWLISPPLDLTGVAAAQLTWWELGDYANLADHRLMIHPTVGDPTAPGWEELALLDAPPEDAWGRSVQVDLSPWRDAASAHIAWVYRGQYSDAWYMDAVEVRALGPDLHLSNWVAGPVDPGGSAQLFAWVENRSTVDAPILDVSWEVDPAEGSVSGTPEISLAAGETAMLTGEISVDSLFSEHARLPVGLTLADADQIWSFAPEVLVGAPAVATVTVALWETGWVAVEVGTGDPETPLWSSRLDSGLMPAGLHRLELDLLDGAPFLPPGPGADRWWAKMVGTSGISVQEVSLAWDGESWTRTPMVRLDDLAAVVWLPEPPELKITVAESANLAPGSMGTWSLSLANEGADTVGHTELRVLPDGAELPGLPVGWFSIAEQGLARSEAVGWTWDVEVPVDKVDSQPIPVRLEVRDEVESFELDTEISVPWPVLTVARVEVDDWATGNRDGRMDPGETVQLRLTLANQGKLATAGALTCALSVRSGAAEVRESEGNFLRLDVGDAAEEDDFAVAVTPDGGGAVAFGLACADGVASYSSEFSLQIGEVPWTLMALAEDPRGDAATGWDLRGGRWRVSGANLEIELWGWNAPEPGTLFLEFWGKSVGSPWSWYQGVFQSGYGVLRGYRDGVFTRLSEPEVLVGEDGTVHLDLPLEALDLIVDSISMGFGSGFCGGSTYYCDHYPDGWGDPYQAGLNTSVWVTFAW